MNKKAPQSARQLPPPNSRDDQPTAQTTQASLPANQQNSSNQLPTTRPPDFPNHNLDGFSDPIKPTPVMNEPPPVLQPPTLSGDKAAPKLASSQAASVTSDPAKNPLAQTKTSISPARYKRRKLLSGLFIIISVFSILLASIAGWLVWLFWVR